ncbi:MAG: hypothetical protein FJX67_00265 [Alphaproteobacteria bacterium]|nr:hypothetical protein [Alphaproteobacteria bacterium]
MTKRRSVLAFALVLAAMAGPANAANFYEGKILAVVVNYGAGGNIDTEARVYVRHLAKHIPGNPTIVVQNVAGAGGMSAINQLGMGVLGKPDGLTVGFVTLNPIAPMVDDPVLRVPYEKFGLVAGLGGWIVAYGRKDIKPGIAKPADMAKGFDVFAAGYAASSNHDVRLHLTLDMMGAKFKVVTGFQSAGEVNQAMERREINFTSSSAPAFYSQVLPNLIRPGHAMPMWVYGVSTPDGREIGSAEHERQGIKSFADVYAEAHGKKPSGPQYEAYRVITDVSTRLSRGILMPPNTPAEPINELYKAFVSLMKDKDFLDDHVRVIGVQPELVSPEDGRSYLAQLAKTSPEAKAAVKQAIGRK